MKRGKKGSPALCQLCEKRGHRESNCFIYDNPAKVLERLNELCLCKACMLPLYAHKGGCSLGSILYHNRGGVCRRCNRVDHIFWTCNGSTHPGSQFKRNVSEPDNNLSLLHNARVIEQNCRRPEFSKMNNHNQKNETSLKSHSTKNFTEPVPANSDEIIIKLESKLGSIVDKKLESVIVELKKLKDSSETKVESCKCKCQNEDKDDSDQIIKLEAQIEKKDDLINIQKEEIKRLNIEKTKLNDKFSSQKQDYVHQISSLKATIADAEKNSKENKLDISQQDIEIIFSILGKTFPELRNLDSNLDNASVAKILENLLDERENELLKRKTDVKDIK